MNLMRRHLTYANVAATLALVFSMAGGAMAASHYLIHSTRQISPKVLKKLKGRRGKTGRRGAQGPTGALGAQGGAGAQGPTGATGPQGSAGPFPGVLPRGITLRGNYNIRFTATASGQFEANSISFGFEFASTPEKHYVGPGETATGACAGGTVENPQATAGNICFFSLASGDTSNPGNYEEPSRFGSKIEILSAGAGSAYDFGTWAATSP